MSGAGKGHRAADHAGAQAGEARPNSHTFFSRQSVSLDQLRTFYSLFKRLEGRAKVDERMFVSLVRQVLGSTFSRAEMQQLFMKIDANSDGDLTWDEFVDFLFFSQDVADQDEAAGETALQFEQAQAMAEGAAVTEQLLRAEAQTGVEFMPTLGAFVSWSREGSVRLWNAQTLELQATLYTTEEAKPDWVTCVRHMHGSNKLAIGSLKSCITLVDMSSGYQKVFGRIHQRELHQASPLCLEYAHFAGAVPLKEDVAPTADAARGEIEGREILFVGDDAGVVTICEFPARSWTVGNFFSLHGVKGSRVRRFCKHTDHVTKLAYIEELELLLTASLDSTIYGLDVERNSVRFAFTKHTKAVYDFQWISSAKLVASCGLQADIYLWSPYSPGSFQRLSGHTSFVSQVLPLGEKLLSVSAQREVKLWDIKHQRCLQTMEAEQLTGGQRIVCAALEARAHTALLVTRRFHAFHLREPVTRSTTGRTHDRPVVQALYNAQFHQIVTVDTREVKVWDAGTGRLLVSYFAAPEGAGAGELTTAVFDTSMRRIITGDHAGRELRMWNFSSGALLGRLLKTTRPPPPPRESAFVRHATMSGPEAKKAAAAAAAEVAATAAAPSRARSPSTASRASPEPSPPSTGRSPAHSPTSTAARLPPPLAPLLCLAAGELGMETGPTPTPTQRSRASSVASATPRTSPLMRGRVGPGAPVPGQALGVVTPIPARVAQLGGGGAASGASFPLAGSTSRMPESPATRAAGGGGRRASVRFMVSEAGKMSARLALPAGQAGASADGGTDSDADDGSSVATAEVLEDAVGADAADKLLSRAKPERVVRAREVTAIVHSMHRAPPAPGEAAHLTRFVMCSGWDRAVHMWLDEGAGEDGAALQVPSRGQARSFPKDANMGHQRDVSCMCAYPPNGVATGDKGGRIIMWNIATSDRVAWLDLGSEVECMAYVAVASTLVVGLSDGGVAFVDVLQGREFGRLHGAHGARDRAVVRVAADPSGDYLLTGDARGGVKVWSVDMAHMEAARAGAPGAADAAAARAYTTTVHRIAREVLAGGGGRRRDAAGGGGGGDDVERMQAVDLPLRPALAPFLDAFSYWDAHSDAVTALSWLENARLMDVFFLSAGLDGMVKLWTLNGGLVGMLGAAKEWSLARRSTFRAQSPDMHAVRRRHRVWALDDAMSDPVGSALKIDSTDLSRGAHAPRSAARAGQQGRATPAAGSLAISAEQRRTFARTLLAQCRPVFEPKRDRSGQSLARRQLKSAAAMLFDAADAEVGGGRGAGGAAGGGGGGGTYRAARRIPAAGEVWVRYHDETAEMIALVTVTRVDEQLNLVSGWDGLAWSRHSKPDTELFLGDFVRDRAVHRWRPCDELTRRVGCIFSDDASHDLYKVLFAAKRGAWIKNVPALEGDAGGLQSIFQRRGSMAAGSTEAGFGSTRRRARASSTSSMRRRTSVASVASAGSAGSDAGGGSARRRRGALTMVEDDLLAGLEGIAAVEEEGGDEDVDEDGAAVPRDVREECVVVDTEFAEHELVPLAPQDRYPRSMAPLRKAAARIVAVHRARRLRREAVAERLRLEEERAEQRAEHERRLAARHRLEEEERRAREGPLATAGVRRRAPAPQLPSATGPGPVEGSLGAPRGAPTAATGAGPRHPRGALAHQPSISVRHGLPASTTVGKHVMSVLEAMHGPGGNALGLRGADSPGAGRSHAGVAMRAARAIGSLHRPSRVAALRRRRLNASESGEGEHAAVVPPIPLLSERTSIPGWGKVGGGSQSARGTGEVPFFPTRPGRNVSLAAEAVLTARYDNRRARGPAGRGADTGGHEPSVAAQYAMLQLAERAAKARAAADPTKSGPMDSLSVHAVADVPRHLPDRRARRTHSEGPDSGKAQDTQQARRPRPPGKAKLRGGPPAGARALVG